MMQPDFFQIPRIVALDKKLQDQDKFVYAAIYWLERLKMGKCTASNEALGKIIGCKSPLSIANSLNRLEEKGYIQRIFADKGRRNRKEIRARVVYAHVSSVSDTVSSDGDTQVSSVSEQSIYNYVDNKNVNTKKGEGGDVFEAFWSMYPKRTGKANAKAQWDKLTPDDHQKILEDVPKRKVDDKWARGYVKDPERYLKYRQWEDDIIPAKSSELSAMKFD